MNTEATRGNHLRHLFAFIFIVMICAGCKKEDMPTSGTVAQLAVTDANLYALARLTGEVTYYKHSFTILPHAAGSGHTDFPFLRTRYNKSAVTQLDANGKVYEGSIFPDSSLIVKELIATDSTIQRYAIMFKLTGALNTDVNGWAWAEISATGSVAYSVSNKGTGCFGCHSSGIDYTRMNDSHP